MRSVSSKFNMLLCSSVFYAMTRRGLGKYFSVRLCLCVFGRMGCAGSLDENRL